MDAWTTSLKFTNLHWIILWTMCTCVLGMVPHTGQGQKITELRIAWLAPQSSTMRANANTSVNTFILALKGIERKYFPNIILRYVTLPSLFSATLDASLCSL